MSERVRRVSTLAILGAVLCSGGFATLARADGDPASDYLVGRQVFLSAGLSSVSSSERQLLSVVAAANRAGFAIRVAVIANEYDLGSVTALWRKPRLYARFLGLELSSVFEQRLLVVMPDGFGFYWPHHRTGSAYRVLSHVSVGSGDSGPAAAAQTAVRRLAAAAGVTLTPAASARPNATVAVARGHDQAAIIAACAAALALALALFVRGLRRRRAPPTIPSEPPLAGRRASWVRSRWAVPGLAVMCGLAVAVAIVALRGVRHASAISGTSADAVATPPPFSWPAGRRVAPEFVLRDQNARRVSLAAYRGRPVIVTFVDPLCRNLCPLEAHLLNYVVSQMPAAKRPEILAVSVDVYANARRNLVQDVSKWELVPQWRWAVGRPEQLAAVWKQYKVGVSVTTKKIAATTIKYIIHTEAAYVIDATGHERALFLWPFYPRDLEATLRKLT